MVEERTLRLAVGTTEENAEVWMTVIPANHHPFVARLQARPFPNVWVHFERNACAVELHTAREARDCYSKGITFARVLMDASNQ